MPIPGDMLKGRLSRGANLTVNGLKDFIFGYKAKAGNIKLTETEKEQFSDFISSAGNNESDFPLAKNFKNKAYMNQNNLEAFYIDQGKNFKEGDTLSLSGFDALRSRYMYKSPFTNSVAVGGKSELSAGEFMIRDALDVAAATTAGIIGFKAVQTGVSLIAN